MKARIKRTLQSAGNYLVQPHLTNLASRDPRSTPSVKAALTGTMLSLQSQARSGDTALPRLRDSGLRIFSQFEEDGYLAYLAAVLELEPKIFVDIGAADGINSNCANLAINLGWHGLFLEGDAEKVHRAREFYASQPDTAFYPPVIRQAFITAENINELIKEAGFSGDIGICSIDIDGNDCWVWKALEVISPAVVIIETHVELGMRNIAVPYDPQFHYPGKHPEYFGASGVAMNSLAAKKGYRLVGANRYGFNLIFVRGDVFPDRVPAVPLESLLGHPRFAEKAKLTEPIQGWDFVEL